MDLFEIGIKNKLSIAQLVYCVSRAKKRGITLEEQIAEVLQSKASRRVVPANDNSIEICKKYGLNPNKGSNLYWDAQRINMDFEEFVINSKADPFFGKQGRKPGWKKDGQLSCFAPVVITLYEKRNGKWTQAISKSVEVVNDT